MYRQRLERLSMRTMSRPLELIRHWQSEGSLEMNQPYQRGVVWGRKRQQNLIKSILMGIPIPSLIVNDRFAADWPGENPFAYSIIDGKQRCTAILRFLAGELPVPAWWFDLEGDEVTCDMLPEPEYRRFKQTPIGVSEGTFASIEEEQLVFELVNFGGVAQGDTDDDVYVGSD